MDTIQLFVGVPGGPELLIILGIAVLLFGANKLPALARSSGQALGEFKKGRQEIEDELRAAAEAEETDREDGDDVSEAAVDATAADVA
ncbi:Sec-independent protein translocase subunit TatA/TatB [Halorientalis pallida]|uniref:Sec-independent protein translocase protein TatA n=1 Tax=Halorientalis pallida TaxID=2479928 RepID=A0A498L6P3_9EURY|nr:twin-arginine translocase TatA/TatE family subunit [Halorientalis pallida]RXK50375.1 twin-arginine translocase TatA/TatE family subunit [Halorientalis pallida]